MYFAPTFFYKTDYEQRILAVMDQIPVPLKGVVMLDYARERKSNLPRLPEIINAYPPLPKEECAQRRQDRAGYYLDFISYLRDSRGTKGRFLLSMTTASATARKRFNQELGIGAKAILCLCRPR